MFEKEIKFIYDFNINKTKSLGNFTTFIELSKITLHPAILRFISADIDFLIFEDRQKLLKNSAFDYSGEKISQYFSLINDEIKQSKKLSADYVNKLILHAVTFNVNFLVRPKWALEKFVFEDSPSKSIVEINQILDYLYFYPHLKKIVSSYLAKKKLLSINQSDFKDLLTNIDKITIDSSLPSVIETAVNSIKEFFSIGSVGKDLVQLSCLKIFIKEKELTPLLNILETHFGSDEKVKVNAKEVLNILLNMDSSDEIFMDEKNQNAEFDKEEKTEEIISDSDFNKLEEKTEFEISEKEETFLSHFEETPIKNVEEVDEITEKELVDEESLNKYNELLKHTHEEPTDDDLLLHNQKDENPETLLPDEHYEAEAKDEIKENEKSLFEKTDIKENEYSSEDPSEIIGDDDYFKDLDHFDFLTEESESEPKKEIDSEREEIEPEIKKIVHEKKSEEIEQVHDEDEEEIIEEKSDLRKTNEVEESIFELKDSTILDDFFVEEGSAEEFVEEEQVEPETKETIESEQDDFLENEIDDCELLEEFEDETESPLETENIVKEDEKEEAVDELFQIEETEVKEESQLHEEFEETNKQETEEIESEEKVEEKYYDDSRTEKEQAAGKRMIEMSDLLENKNMTRIIEVVFDYDMEDFANTIEKISECEDKSSALSVLSNVFETNRINPTSKDAEALKEIISQYFDEH